MVGILSYLLHTVQYAILQDKKGLWETSPVKMCTKSYFKMFEPANVLIANNFLWILLLQELLGVAYNRIIRMDISSGDSLKTWRYNTLKNWHVNWEVKQVFLDFEGERLTFACLNADCKVVHEYIGGYIFLSMRSQDKNQTLNEELFHKLTGGWNKSLMWSQQQCLAYSTRLPHGADSWRRTEGLELLGKGKGSPQNVAQRLPSWRKCCSHSAWRRRFPPTFTPLLKRVGVKCWDCNP